MPAVKGDCCPEQMGLPELFVPNRWVASRRVASRRVASRRRMSRCVVLLCIALNCTASSHRIGSGCNCDALCTTALAHVTPLTEDRRKGLNRIWKATAEGELGLSEGRGLKHRQNQGFQKVKK